MRAWMFTGTGEPLQRADIEEPKAGPDEIVLDIQAAGLCHSDVGLLDKPGFMRTLSFHPIVPGHEIAGVVSEVGSAVTDFVVGDRVGVWNSEGNEAPGYGRHGGYTMKHLVPAARAVHLPDEVSFEYGANGTDAGMTSIHAMLPIGGLEPGMKVGFVGFGGIGQFGAAAGVVLGAEVHIATRNEAVWPYAEEIGATSVVSTADEWKGKGLDLVIDCAGTAATVSSSIRAVRRGGTVVLVGYGELQLQIDSMDLVMAEVQLKGSRAGLKTDVEKAYELIASGRVKPPLRTVDFDGIPQALDDLRHHRHLWRTVALNQT